MRGSQGPVTHWKNNFHVETQKSVTANKNLC